MESGTVTLHIKNIKTSSLADFPRGKDKSWPDFLERVSAL